jgi:diguanylate cyclase (GGDEF)-like protein
MTNQKTRGRKEEKREERRGLEPGEYHVGGVIVLSGTHTGRFFAVERPLILGRADVAQIHLDEHGVSRRHAELVPLPGGGVRLNDLQSTNGTFVNGARVDTCRLRDGDRIDVGVARLLKFSLKGSEQTSFLEQVYESATRDPLTACLNRQVFDAQLPPELAFCRRHKRSLAVAVFDLDGLRTVNATHGHLAGDLALRQVAGSLLRLHREQDILARYAGDEFALLMREVSESEAWFAVDRLRTAVEQTSVVFEGKPIAVTACAGIVLVMPPFEIEGDALLREADRSLREAKQCGQNSVVSIVL